MDKSSLIGLPAGVALIVAAIFLGGSLMMFINIPGVLIVLGGTPRRRRLPSQPPS